WMWSRGRAETAADNYRTFLSESAASGESLEDYWDRTGREAEFLRRDGDGRSSVKYWIPPREYLLADNNWLDLKGYANHWGFKTENSEILLQRILDATTAAGDWVCDFFLGSGTTAATAHKMGRKWIGVEAGDHCETIVWPRLKRVLAGESSGISKAVDWSGGGMFQYLRLESYEDALNSLAEAAVQPQAARRDSAHRAAAREEAYHLRYLLHSATRDAGSLLNLERLDHPFDYELDVQASGGPRQEKADLVETFNCVRGLRVLRQCDWVNQEDLATQDGRARKYRVVQATDREQAKRILVLWRDASNLNPDLERRFLEAQLRSLEKNGDVFDQLLINGDAAVGRMESLDGLFKRLMNLSEEETP
ncbi:MAG: DNA methyltransferase, partial [Planctomycetales bacterium]